MVASVVAHDARDTFLDNGARFPGVFPRFALDLCFRLPDEKMTYVRFQGVITVSESL